MCHCVCSTVRSAGELNEFLGFSTDIICVLQSPQLGVRFMMIAGIFLVGGCFILLA